MVKELYVFIMTTSCWRHDNRFSFLHIILFSVHGPRKLKTKVVRDKTSNVKFVKVFAKVILSVLMKWQYIHLVSENGEVARSKTITTTAQAIITDQFYLKNKISECL